MHFKDLFLVALVALWAVSRVAEACKGCVELDEITFDKLIRRFPVTVVKFDVAYPYGNNHEAFSSFALDVADVDDLLVGLVGIKDYGEKDNAELGKLYKATEKDLPVIKLIKRDDPRKWIDYKPSALTVSAEDLKAFVRDNSDLYIGLAGCLQEFDQLAGRFMDALAVDEKSAQEVLQDAQEEEKKFNGEENSGRMYIAIMQRILEKGAEFIASERERVKSLQGKKVSAGKKVLLEHRMNILAAFKATASASSDKSEL
ncbi:protein windbeutel [Phlebotomus argentipes]|uniref:protein windbeutel n=1 Tax=Phlebotomus argentipes TaxID=94469 RepID=UPI002892EC40|nr:protein windbeutel [Phlebotomus argentipes]